MSKMLLPSPCSFLHTWVDLLAGLLAFSKLSLASKKAVRSVFLLNPAFVDWCPEGEAPVAGVRVTMLAALRMGKDYDIQVTHEIDKT